MRWSSGLHYVGAVGDHPSQLCLFPGNKGWEGKQNINVLGAIKNTTTILDNWDEDSASDDDIALANEAMKFFVHFMGDMHMPLHLTGRDRGGNSDTVTFDGRKTNLHSVWDSFIIAKGIRTVPRNYSRPLPFPKIEHSLRGTIYDPYVRRIMFEGLMGKWKDEVTDWLSCPSISPELAEGAGMWQQVMSAWGSTTGRFSPSQFDDDVICPYTWAQPLHQLNCDIIWPKALDEPPYDQQPKFSPIPEHEHEHTSSLHEEMSFVDSDDPELSPKPKPKPKPKKPEGPWLELDTPEYTGAIADQWIVEKLLAMGGVRLAGILNYLFADDDGECMKRGLTLSLDL